MFLRLLRKQTLINRRRHTQDEVSTTPFFGCFLLPWRFSLDAKRKKTSMFLRERKIRIRRTRLMGGPSTVQGKTKRLQRTMAGYSLKRERVRQHLFSDAKLVEQITQQMRDISLKREALAVRLAARRELRQALVQEIERQKQEAGNCDLWQLKRLSRRRCLTARARTRRPLEDAVFQGDGDQPLSARTMKPQARSPRQRPLTAGRSLRPQIMTNSPIT